MNNEVSSYRNVGIQGQATPSTPNSMPRMEAQANSLENINDALAHNLERLSCALNRLRGLKPTKDQSATNGPRAVPNGHTDRLQMAIDAYLLMTAITGDMVAELEGIV